MTIYTKKCFHIFLFYFFIISLVYFKGKDEEVGIDCRTVGGIFRQILRRCKFKKGKINFYTLFPLIERVISFLFSFLNPHRPIHVEVRNKKKMSLSDLSAWIVCICQYVNRRSIALALVDSVFVFSVQCLLYKRCTS